jgi:hypothetical protein
MLVLGPHRRHFCLLDSMSASEIPVPSDFFTQLPSTAPRDAFKHTPPHYLQHLVHAVLHHRAFEHPVTKNNLTIYPTRVPFPRDAHEYTKMYRELAQSAGARLLDISGEGGPSEQAYYYRFGVRMTDATKDSAIAAASVGASPTSAAASTPTPAPIARKKKSSVRVKQELPPAAVDDGGVAPMEIDRPDSQPARGSRAGRALPLPAPGPAMNKKIVIRKVVVQKKTTMAKKQSTASQRQ